MLNYSICIGIYIFVCAQSFGQELSSMQLLDKAIAYHDPNGEWISFKGSLSITMTTPNGNERISDIIIDIPSEYFNLTVTKDENVIEQTIHKDSCVFALNGSSEISKRDMETFKLNCAQTKKMRDYYTYLYGLPMKLKDPGTLLDPVVRTKSFNGKEYVVLQATYEASVGMDIWYFYLDPITHAMEVYQFFHDESKNDGEYILLSGEEELMGIRIPKTRAWYYNKDNTYLGTDILTKASKL